MNKFLKQLSQVSLGLSVLYITACTNDNGDLVKYMNEVKLQPSHHIASVPPFDLLPSFKFPDNKKRRNPFKPVLFKKNANVDAPSQKHLKQPLETYPQDALKFVGFLEQDTLIWALIKQPDNHIVPVRVGDYMGKNWGQVIAIKKNLIRLEETIKNAGGWEKKVITIYMSKIK